MRRWTLVLVSGVLASAQPQATIRTETRVVQIQVEVRDAHGRPVGGLTKDDFTVFDTRKRRSVDIFGAEGAVEPAREDRGPALPPNVFSNRSGGARPESHVTVILIDLINNYWDDVATARQRLIQMAGKLSKGERIAIYAATTQPAGVTIVQDFTSDRDRLLRTMQAFTPPAIRPAPVAGIPPPPTSAAEEDLLRRRAILDTMSAFRLLSDHLGKLPGRKRLLWLTSGLPPKQLREIPDPFDKAAAALNEANVAVDVLDDDGVGDFHRRWGPAAWWNLRDLAERTGGDVWLHRNDLENMLVEAVETPRVSYTLGFYLPDEERDERFHPLEVRVARPHLTVSHRMGYFAGVVQPPAAPKKREPLENALLDPQDATEIGIVAALTVAPGTPRPTLRISMKLDAPQLSLREAEGQWSGKVEELFLEIDSVGRALAKVGDVKEFRMTARAREEIERTGVPLAQDLGLLEGATRLLIVVRDVESGRTGSVSIALGDVSAGK